jgi:hypothetical protein
MQTATKAGAIGASSTILANGNFSVIPASSTGVAPYQDGTLVFPPVL